MRETPRQEWLARLDFRRWLVFLAARSRQGWRRVEEVGHLPAIGDMVADCAAATHRTSNAIPHWIRPESARTLLLVVAARSSPAEIDSTDWRPTALMSKVRALTADLLQATGCPASTPGLPSPTRGADRSLKTTPPSPARTTPPRCGASWGRGLGGRGWAPNSTPGPPRAG